ncbi:MAG: hypothetical protein ABI678_24915, partial [Kofleriaceae bacterium]
MLALEWQPRPQAFDARLATTYQQALRVRAETEQMIELAAAASRALAALELTSTPALARLGLAPEQIDLVWAIVACSIDARLVPHLETLGGSHARRGLSLSVYAMLAELADDSVARLAHWLAGANLLVSLGLIVSAEPGVSPAARAYVASSRLIALLRDEEHAIAPLQIVAAPDQLLHDADQLATIREIRAALARSAHPVLVIEGPLGAGRTTACACAAGADLIVLDLAKLTSSELGDALIALRREALLRDRIPVLANVDQMLGEDRRDERRVIGAFVEHVAGPLFVTTTVPGTDLGAQRAMVRIGWNVPGLAV